MFTTLDLHDGVSQQNGTPTNRPKRNQVRRACDWCKLMRIKCDNHRPCSNCQNAQRECGMGGGNQFRSIAAAVKEIETLRAQVKHLQELKTNGDNSVKYDDNDSGNGNEKPWSSNVNTSHVASLSRSYADQPSASSCDGVRVDSTFYGVGSLPFFVKNMGGFIQTTRQQTLPNLDISGCFGAANIPAIIPQDGLITDYLRPAEEMHSFDLFWQTHYFSHPILHEAQFRTEYTTLVAESMPGEPRMASPLVDIILALSIQLGSSSRNTNGFHTNHSDSPRQSCPSLAGYQYYQRCQQAIDQSIEIPSITTVQCCVFSIVYLYEAGLLNRAQVTIGKAIMMAMMLGLPNEPALNVPEPQREVARRTWWSLYILDTKLSMEVGRPPIIGPSHSTCHLPSDSPEVARWLAPHYPYNAACPTWLGFQTQTLRLLDAVRSVRSAFYAKYDSAVGENGYMHFVTSATFREECARVLTEQMKDLNAWTKQVPLGYFVPRKNGHPYSTDQSPLELDPGPNVIIHCQRHRLLLELQYHQYCMMLYRSFICFAPNSEIQTPLSDSQAAAALNHAMELTSMIHQALISSEALSGIYSAFRWQKEALFTMLGFAYSFPTSHLASEVRSKVDIALAIIDKYRDTLPEAGRVAAVARVLAEDVSAVTTRACSTGNSTSPPPLFTSLGGSITSTVTAPSDALPSDKAEPAIQASTLASPSANNEIFDLNFLRRLEDASPYTWEGMDFLLSNPDTGDTEERTTDTIS
ncbi:fungal-specific transcription factor domain-containing protein [Hypoxylon trugodes]|uniref:fungal-specific transcription factor domain-containing protein n=1 Tax=Hypoxylon trugodes TaxID=326681 RepID=UPI00219101B2|nr:fungal-specific transcription factor domain-containing protein [Hypoxylon trugodes]KAI1385487.1 fungal-specific transcription factor domain-containing protein [Hypoxylon trugodes]